MLMPVVTYIHVCTRGAYDEYYSFIHAWFIHKFPRENILVIHSSTLGLFIYSRLAATGYSRPTVNFAEQRLLQTQTFLPNVRQLVLSVQSSQQPAGGLERRGEIDEY
jgi:hypothetical protein